METSATTRGSRRVRSSQARAAKLGEAWTFWSSIHQPTAALPRTLRFVVATTAVVGEFDRLPTVLERYNGNGAWNIGH